MVNQSRLKHILQKMMFETILLLDLLAVSSGILIFVLSPALSPLKWTGIDAIFLCGFIVMVPFLLAVIIIDSKKRLQFDILRNYFSYFIYALVALYIVIFIYRDHANRLPSEYLKKAVEGTNSHYFVPEDKNAVFFYIQAAKNITGQQAPEGLFESGLWRESDHPQWSEWLNENKDAISLALKAGRKEALYFPLEISNKHLDSSQIRIIGRLCYLSRILCVKARCSDSNKNISESLLYLDSAFKIGASLSKRDFFSFAVGLTCKETAVRSIHDIMKRPYLSKDELRSISGMLKKWSLQNFISNETWKGYAKMEAAYLGEEIMATMREGNNVVSYLKSVFLSKKIIRDHVDFYWDYVLKSNSLPEMVRRLEGYSQTERLKFLSKSNSHASKIIAEFLAGMYTIDIEKLLEQQARIEILRAYAGACLFKITNGFFSNDWSRLVPTYLENIPQDPFSGQPLKLKLKDDSFVIYSIGHDIKDSGGIGLFFRRKKTLGISEEDRKKDIVLIIKSQK